METTQSPTHGMSLGERIAHVGGRTNAAGYIEFGSPMAVDALIQQVLRDIAAQPETWKVLPSPADDAAIRAAALEEAAKIAEQFCACDDPQDQEEANWVLRNRAQRIRALIGGGKP